MSQSPEEQALYGAVKAGSEELLGRIATVIGAKQGWREQLRAAAYELLAFLEEDPQRARQMVIESALSGEEVRAVREASMQGFTALVDLGRAEMADPEELPRAVAEITAGSIYNRLHVAIEQGDFSAGESMVPELMYCAVLPYLGVEAALEELRMAPPG